MSLVYQIIGWHNFGGGGGGGDPLDHASHGQRLSSLVYDLLTAF